MGDYKFVLTVYLRMFLDKDVDVTIRALDSECMINQFLRWTFRVIRRFHMTITIGSVIFTHSHHHL